MERALQGFAKWMRKSASARAQEDPDDALWTWFLCNEP